MAIASRSYSCLRTPLIHIRPIYDTRLGYPASSTTKDSTRLMSTGVTDTTRKFQPANRLSGRTCLITGGTSGIGFAIAERFLQEGASSIILVGRSQERLQNAAARLSTSTDVTKNSVSTEISDQIRLLVGDLGEAGSWMRELEREMVATSIPRGIVI